AASSGSPFDPGRQRPARPLCRRLGGLSISCGGVLEDRSDHSLPIGPSNAVGVALAAWRRSPWLEGAANAAATLLLVDAWFDILTSASHVELGVSIAEAAFVELPLAVICLLLARDAERVLARLELARRSEGL